MNNFTEELQKFKFKKEIAMRWSDMDTAFHVNNAVYLTYLEQARVYYYEKACQWNWDLDGMILANAQVNYIRPLVFPEPAFIYVRTSKMGNKSMTLDYVLTVEKDGKIEVAATASTVVVMFDYATKESIAVRDEIRQKIEKFEA